MLKCHDDAELYLAAIDIAVEIFQELLTIIDFKGYASCM